MKVKSNQGYEEEAESLLGQYEQLSFEDVHRHVLDLMPKDPATILDIGAGTGRDAGYLSGNGHRVVAIEPTDGFRDAAKKQYPSAQIEWIDDALPNLTKIIGRVAEFDLIMITAVWMHLDQVEREHAMPVVSSLLKSGGLLIMNLRHGPVPAGRRMFEISDGEMLELASAHGLEIARQHCSESIQETNRRAGVNWSHFVFRKGC